MNISMPMPVTNDGFLYMLTSSRLLKFFFIAYIVAIFCLFLYSFTQVDLNLTLSRASWFQTIEKSFQYLGYWKRPFSADLFSGLVTLLCAFYIFFLRLASKNAITQKQVWILICITTGILTFAYNAFSYDLFNYMFDAKIFSFYHQNPYLHKALDFPQDKMVHFMRWTHRTYPYGPVWLVLTIPLSFIGLQIFLPTFFLFKFLMAGSFLGTCFFIQKISKKIFPEQVIFNLAFFAFNPLVLIESLVSGHIDIVMMFFAMAAVWFLITKKYFRASVFLMLSMGIKFATGLLVPVFVYITGCFRSKSPPYSMFFFIAAMLMSVGVVWESYTSGNFQPWYLLIVLPFASLIGKKYYIMIPTAIMTLFALLEYVPYLYQGDWNPPVPMRLFWLTTSGIVLSVVVSIITGLVFKMAPKRFVISTEPHG